MAAYAGGQLRLLRAALSWPSVREVVYSTCSVHCAENEAVVAAALETAEGWTLRPALPRWHRRGEAGAGLPAQLALACCRFCPREDLTAGFFVACFTRLARSVEE